MPIIDNSEHVKKIFGLLINKGYLFIFPIDSFMMFVILAIYLFIPIYFIEVINV